jgi:acyl transferase domain-containing protein/thioesterase domain-containing protein
VELGGRGIECQRVRIAIAAHSRLLDPILGEFEAFLRSIPLAPPNLPVVSNRTGRELSAADAVDPAYWVAHLRNTVRFADCVGSLLQDPRNVFLEVGPGRTLSSLARLHPAWRADRSAIASLRHPDEQAEDDAFLLAAHGRLWAAGVDVDLAKWVDRPGSRKVSLPTYAFRHQDYWVEPDSPTSADPAQRDIRRTDDVSQWAYVPRYVPVEAPDGPPAGGTWLLFLDDAGCLAELATRLRSTGAQVVQVRLGDAFVARGNGEYLLGPELGEEGYLALFRDLAANGQLPDQVVHGWLLTQDRSFRPGSSWFHRCQEQGFHSLLFLLRAMAAEELHGVRLTVVANGIGGPDGGAELDVEKATALGPVLVAPREFAQLQCALVDVMIPRRRRGEAWRSHWQGVARSLESACGILDSGVHALRGTAWFRAVHRRAPALAPSLGRPARLRERGTYLVTGAFGGIGTVLTEWLARTVRARLVLQSRTALPQRQSWDEWLVQHGPDHRVSQSIRHVRRLEAAGAEVLVLTADVANVVEMRRGLDAVASGFGPLHGVFHAAGVVEDGLIASKDPDEMERVLAPKVQGSLVLCELLGDKELDFLLFFSSTSAALGPAGQADYVAANSFLNALARRDAARGKPVAALQWGTWNGIGMTRAMLANGAVGGRRIRIGGPVFEELLQTGSDQWQLLATLDPASTWMLDEHRTAEGDAILPGSAYADLFGQAVRAVGESGPFELRDVFFFRPLHVPDGATRRVRCKLRRTPEGLDAVFQSHCELGAGASGWQTHAQARVLLHALEVPADVDLAAADAGCPMAEAAGDTESLRTGQFRHLAFGPRWQVLREIRYGRGKAMARLALPRSFSGEAATRVLHPALFDLATGFAMELVDDYVPDRLWVPVSYGSVRVHAPLQDSVVSLVRRCEVRGAARDLATFDLVVCTVSGRVLVEVEGFSIHRLAPGNSLDGARQPQAGDLEPDPRAVAASPAERVLADAVAQGIRPEEGMDALARVLASPLVPELLLSPVPLEQLRAAVDAAVPAPSSSSRFARPTLDSEFVEPRDEVERTLVQFWQELLGVAQVGVRDSFFDLGGHSLIAVRLFARIRKTFQVDYPISVLFDAPTVEACAAMLRRDGAAGTSHEAVPVRSEGSRNRYRHLVPMRTSTRGATPFFLVAGMFGNVLNLRHLAHLLGEDRSFYGLQARGLYGDMEPHATFEEAARDHIAELRTVQPKGPYLLGGFSGGGLTAFEMARQLRAQGEEVGLLVLLDTPLPRRPQLTAMDRVRIQAQNLSRQGLGYVGAWFRNRVRWEWEQFRRRMGWLVDSDDADRFQSAAVGKAFRAALVRYQMVPETVDALLFRPALDRHHRLGGGRYASWAREIVAHDNFWSPFVRRLDVVEVPGDHDSMVLEPNVRALAQELRVHLQRFDARHEPGS